MTLHAPQTTTSVRRYVPGLASIVDGARTSALDETLTGDESLVWSTQREASDIAAPEATIVHTRAPLRTSDPEQGA